MIRRWAMNRRFFLPIVGAAILAVSGAERIRAQDVLGDTGIKGAGSTFVYPLLSRWSREYRAAHARGNDHPGPDGGLDDPPATTALEYEPIGSLGGTLRVKDRAVDFGVSDMPMKPEELARAGLVQFPIVMGGVVVATNVDGVAAGRLKLRGPLLADIFLGKVARWSDGAIAALNPDVRLPDAPIVVVHRSDGSGTSFNFTDYLSKVSPEWKLRVGSAMLVKWPTGRAAKGNEGVAQVLKATRNSIGYLDYVQASQAGLSNALLQNRAGRFVAPDRLSFQASAERAEWAGTIDFYLVSTNAAGDQAYPITATVFALLPKTASRIRAQATLDFFQWVLERGGNTATEVGYIPLGPVVVAQIKRYWSETLNHRMRK